MTTVKQKAYYFLSKRSFFSKELKQKLLEKGFQSNEIDPLIEELKKKNWLKDEERAIDFAQQYRKKGYGAKFISQKLWEKAGLKISPAEASESELVTLIKKKYSKDLHHNKDKIIRALIRRGFSFHSILNALKVCMSGITGEGDDIADIFHASSELD